VVDLKREQRKHHERKQVKPDRIVQMLVKEAEVLNMLGVSCRLYPTSRRINRGMFGRRGK